MLRCRCCKLPRAIELCLQISTMLSDANLMRAFSFDTCSGASGKRDAESRELRHRCPVRIYGPQTPDPPSRLLCGSWAVHRTLFFPSSRLTALGVIVLSHGLMSFLDETPHAAAISTTALQQRRREAAKRSDNPAGLTRADGPPR